MKQIIELVHEVLDQEPMSAEEKLQLKKICELEDAFTKEFSKAKWREYFNIDLEKSIDEQDITEKTKDLITVIYRNYWCNEEEREKIFERFYRIDKSRNRNENRYGLGLAIARDLEAIKFTIELSVEYERSKKALNKLISFALCVLLVSSILITSTPFFVA